MNDHPERAYSLLEARDFFWRNPNGQVLCVELKAGQFDGTCKRRTDGITERLCSTYQQAKDFYDPPLEVIGG